MRLPPELTAEFDRETDERTVVAAQIVYVLAIVLFPLFGILDYVLYPKLAQNLITVRVMTVPVFIVNLGILTLLKRRGKAARWSRLLACGMLYPAVFSIDTLTLISGGAESPYYAGICLALIAMLVSMPWGLKEMAAHAVFFWIQYATMMLIFDSPLEDWRIFVSNNYFMSATVVIGLTWSFTGYRMRLEEFVTRQALAKEKERSHELLLNVLPQSVARELMTYGKVEAREVRDCSILFTDFVGFTDISSRMPAQVMMRSLDRLFVGFDEVIARHGLEKLKTIGDAYMCAGGIPDPTPTHLIDCVLAALDVLSFLDAYRRTAQDELVWKVRIGIHSGPVSAGVIGRTKFAYDVWGDTVNTASRLESASLAGHVNMATDNFRRIAHLFDGIDRGHLPVKGKGLMAMTFVTGIKEHYAADDLRRIPNQAFRELYERYRKQGDATYAIAAPVEPKAPVDASPITVKEKAMNDLLACFSDLTPEDKREVRAISQESPFQEHEILVEQGKPLDALLVLIEGHAGVQITLGNGQNASRIDVSVLGPGDLMGEMSFVTGDLPSASVVAIGRGRLVRLPFKALEVLAQRSAEFRARLYHSIARLVTSRLKDTTSKLPPLIIEDVAQVKRHHSQLTGRIGGESDIPASLLQAIDEFKQGILDIDRNLAQRMGPRGGGGDLEALRAEARPKVAQLCDGLMLSLTAAVKEARDSAHADGIGAYTLRETFASFMQSRMCDRSFSKPRGYAGDYYTIELVYQNQPQGDGRVGPLIDAWFLEIPAARAVRARRRLLKNLLLERYRTYGAGSDGIYRALSLGAGAGRELFDMFAELGDARAVRTTSLDIDIEALDFGANNSREAGLADQMLWAKENVIFLSKGRGQTRLAPQDIIYSAGLFDYLQDDIAVGLLNWIHSHLERRGVAVIGNFDPSNPDRAFMDHILDWRLNHRTAEDMRKLFERSAFAGSKIQVVWEDNHVNHFTIAERS